MKVQVHIKQEKTHICCGPGKNKIRWLADAAIIWYMEMNTDKKKHKITSTPVKVTKSTGQQLPMEAIISSVLNNNDSINVYFTEDIELAQLCRGK